MDRNKYITGYSKKLYEICQKYNVDRLYSFGSVINNHFDPKTSDIDLIVELSPMPPIEKGETLLALWDVLESQLFLKWPENTPDSSSIVS